MNPDDIEPGLRRLCRVVRAAAALGIVLLPALAGWMWSDPGRAAVIGSQISGLMCESIIRVDARMQWLGAALTALPVAMAMAVCIQLWKLFGDYAAGQALTPRAQRRLQVIAWWLLALALLQPLLRAALSVLLTMNSTPHRLVFGLGGDDYGAVVTALALLAIATVMRQAVRAAEENRGFV